MKKIIIALVLLVLLSCVNKEGDWYSQALGTAYKAGYHDGVRIGARIMLIDPDSIEVSTILDNTFDIDSLAFQRMVKEVR